MLGGQPLKFRFLGEMEVARGGERLALPPSKRTRALLAYLVVTGRPHRRERLCSLLWDIPDDPRGALRWSLSKLRALVDEPDQRRIVANRETVAFDVTDADVDLFAVRALAADDIAAASTTRLAELAEAFRGDFLEGLDLSDLDDFHAWCIAEREEARVAHAKLLDVLVSRLSVRPEEALPHARALVQADAYNEHARATLVRLLLAAGRRGEAEQQAQLGMRVLDEPGVASTGELRQAWESLNQAPTPPASEPAAPLPPAPGPPTPGSLSAQPGPEPQPVGEAERKQLTILFADIKGSTELVGDMDPELALKELDPALQAMVNAVHRYEGTVNRVQGDGIMALFGAPRAHEDDAVRACYAALAMQEAVAVVSGGNLAIRVGLNSGEVVVRVLGDDRASHYDAVGGVVHLASRVEHMAKPGTICLTAETARRARGFIKTLPLGPIALRGITEPVDVLELTGTGAARSRRESWTKRNLTKFVGRDVELAKMARALERAETGRGEVVAIVGEPGMGKSRLVHEFVGSPHTKGWTVIETVVTSHDTNATYLPVSNLLRSWFGITKRDTRAQIADKVRSKITDMDQELLSALPAVFSLLDLPVENENWTMLSAPRRRRRTIDAVKALFIRQSQVRPLLLSIDNLHWADGETLAVLNTLVDAMAGARLFLLVTFRPEYKHDWSGKSYFRLIRADPLQSDTFDDLSQVLLGVDPGLDPLRRLLNERTEGNPLFLEESVRDLVETGILEGEKGNYRLVKPIDDFEISSTIQAVLATRIDRLAPASKNLLQIASVIGKDVPVPLLQAITGIPDEQIDDILAELQAAEFVFDTRMVPEAEFAFKHTLTHGVTYGSVLRERRRAIHADVVRAIESRYHNQLGEQIERLAHHALAGELWDKAIDYCLKAAEMAKSRYAYSIAAKFASTACQVAERESGPEAQRISALVLCGDVNSRLGRLDAANEDYAAAIALEKAPVPRQAIENMRHRTGIAIRDGSRIAYYEHGRGDVALLFVNPIVYGLEVFQPILERLCQDFHIITLDPRGTGSSDPLHRPYRLRDHAEDVRAVIEASGVSSIVGVGISRGSNLLVRLMDTNPGLVRRLVFVGGLADLGTAASPAPRTDYLSTVSQLIGDDDLDGLVRYHVGRIFSEPDTQDLAEGTIKRLLQLPKETLLSFYDEDPDMDIRSMLADLRVPTLVMHGTNDLQVPFSAANYLASHIPDAELYAFHDAGHLPLFTATEHFCRVLRRFIETASGTGTTGNGGPTGG